MIITAVPLLFFSILQVSATIAVAWYVIMHLIIVYIAGIYLYFAYLFNIVMECMDCMYSMWLGMLL